MVLNLPILKGPRRRRVTFSMKYVRVVDHRRRFTPALQTPLSPTSTASPLSVKKVCFTSAMRMTSVYDGGPASIRAPWQPNALIVGEDRVAVDQPHADDRTQARRSGHGDARSRGRPPRYIVTAADKAHNLGTNDPQRIHLLKSKIWGPPSARFVFAPRGGCLAR